MLAYLLFGLFFAVLLYLYYLGLFKSLSFQETKLGPLKIFYLEYQGEYHKIGPTFEKVSKDTAGYFKFAKLFGLYFDPPQNVANPKQCRAIVGVILNSGESSSKEEEFAKAYIQYKMSELPLVEASLTTFPYRNKLTYFLFRKIYREIANYIIAKFGESVAKNNSAIMEVYYMHPSNCFIEFYYPHGINAEKYMLTTAPKPQYRNELHED